MRVNRDTVVGIVGAVVLVTAMFGVFQYERAQAGALRGFDVAWSNATLAGPVASGTTPFQEETEAVLDVRASNLTRVAVTVAWTAQQGSDTLRVTLVPPDGSGLSPVTAEETDGEVAVAVDVPNAPPATTRVVAPSEEDARARLAQQPAATLGTGTWTLLVEFTQRTGAVPGSPVPLVPDEQVAWEATTALTVFAPSLTAT